MKKAAVIFISLALTFSLLLGCGAAAAESERSGLESFDKIEYVRPDVETIEAKAQQLYLALMNPLRFYRVNRLLDEFYSLCRDFDTMYVLAYIRSCKDLRDEFYAGEYHWMLESDARVQMITDSVYYACAQSAHALWLEKFKLWDGFRAEYADDGGRDDEFYDKYMELSSREAELLRRYRDVVAEPTLTLAGVEVSFYEYIQYPWGIDYSEAYKRYYEKYNTILGELYIELIAVRNELTELMGYDSFAAMEYEQSFGRDYSPEDAEKFMERVKLYLAPLGKELNERGMYYNVEYAPVSEERLLELLETGAHSLGGSIGEAFDYMHSRGLYDFENSPGKAELSFQTYLPSYEAPYLFISPYGDSGDVLTVFHEFGHYADSYIRCNAYESLDLSESFSQAMQFLCLDSAAQAMSEDEFENLQLMNLLDILDSYLQQSALAEFELRAYAMDEPTVEKLNALSLELSKDYGYYDEYNCASCTYGWADTPHLFESPFYVISYPVSASVALQLYQLELSEEGLGMEKFINMSKSCLPGLMETLAYAGLDDPMSEVQLADARLLFRKYLAA